MSRISAQEIIDLLGLEPLAGEGGLYRQSYRSADILVPGSLPSRYQTSKPAGTAIYYLLTDEADSFSALHRLPTDEVYHFYLGDPVALTMLLPNGGSRQIILGQDLFTGQQVQFVVPADIWQGSRLVPGGAFALLGTTMAPGFTDDDFQAASPAELLTAYPDQVDVIRDLTREDA